MNEVEQTITVYVDGVQVAHGSIKKADNSDRKIANIIDYNASYSGFLSKSIFGNDAYCKEKIADFRVYGGPLSSSEVAALYVEAQSKILKLHQLTIDDAKESLNIILANADEKMDAITKNITLPTTGNNGVQVTWSSSNPDVISTTGVVTRPAMDAEDATVTLTATLSYEGLTDTKEFTVKVLKEFSEQAAAEVDASKLVIYNQDNIKGNIRLATKGENGSTITWVSSDPEIIKGTAQAEAAGDPTLLGRVTRPKDGDKNVTLTAVVQLGSATVEKPFNLKVKKDPGNLDYDAYFFAYFTGEYEGGEEISFAVAEEPLKWRSLNNGKSIIQSKMGEEGLRDPFVLRSHEGDKFYLLATDLKMGESTNFDQAQITGSHYIMIWESDDLVNWSEQRMVEVAPKKGGNTWAPEAFYDEKTGDYVVFWASSMKVEDTYGKYRNGRPSGQYNVMYYATTRDFYTFSEPKVYIDDAFPTIDTTMIEHNGTIYRFTKSEVNMKVYYEKANNVFYDKDGIEANGYQFDLVGNTRNGFNGTIGHGSNNEGPTVFKDIHEDKWYMFLDSWPYHVRYTTDLDDASQFVNNLLPESEYALPPGPRHGTVIPITREEYNALQAKYGVAGPVPSNNPVVHYTFDAGTINGTTVKDVSGNNHDARLVGGATTVANTITDLGNAVELNGSTAYVEMPQNLIKDLNLEKMTIATWVKADKNLPNQRIFDFGSETGRVANRNTMYLSTQGDLANLEFAIVTPFTEKFGSSTATLGSNYKYALRAKRMDANVWHHVAITIDGFDAVLYVDGTEVARSSVFNVEPRMLLETTKNYIGKSRNDNHNLFDGQIDDFRIYNRALSAEEIADLVGDYDIPPGEVIPSGSELILDYDMKNVEGTTVKDSKGNFDGTWINKEKASYMGNDKVGALSFAGGSTDSYIEVPQGVLDGLTDVTVSALVNWKGQNEAEWIFCFGQDQNKYIFVTPKKNSGNRSARAGFGITSWSNEAGADASMTLPSNEWKLVTAVYSGTDQVVTLYVDGEEVGTGSTRGYTLAQINNTGGRSGYVAKSFYTADPYYGGMIADFEVYNGALTESEVKALMPAANEKIVELNKILFDFVADKLDYAHFLSKNVSKDEVITNLSLPTQWESGTTISWQSDKPNVIANDGTVIRPSYADGDQVVTLTATITDGVNTKTRTFTVTVIKMSPDAQRVKLDKEALTVYNINDVRGNLTLPTKGANGSEITWVSSNEAVITPTGEVVRPAHGSGDTYVTLTATITAGNVSDTKIFVAVVREMPEKEELAGYLFAYFIGEGYSNGEQIYMALSKVNDPLHWTELNSGNPIFTSELGENGVRDPFIIRSPEGDKFYLIATDLKIYGNGNWDRAQRYGSLYIMVWESTDLVNWSKQRMVQVSPEVAGCTWAPEAFYDHTTGEYIVFWASKIYPDESKTGSPNQRIMYAKTRDFYTFTEAKEYYNPGYSVIDTTMIEHNGKIYRFTKDERGNSSSSPNGKFIFQEVGDSILGNFRMIKEGIGKGSISQGEGPTIFKANGEDKWYLFIDEFGGRGYVPFETTDLDSGNWTMSSNYQLPSRPRHGTVLPVTATEYERLQNNLPIEVEEPNTGSVTGVTLNKDRATLKVGEEVQLTATITPANATNKAVVWVSSDSSVATVDQTGKVKAQKAGTATITVVTVDGSYTAECVVTVQDQEGPKPEVIKVTGVTLDRTTANVTVNKTIQLIATVKPANATNKKVTWSSSNTSVATVDQTGKVTGVKAGTAIITVTTEDGNFKAQCTVTVTNPSSGGSGGSGGGSSSGGSQPAKETDQPKEEVKDETPTTTETEQGKTPSSQTADFKDTAGHWASEAIDKLVEEGIISGYPDGTFRPNAEITRAEFVTLVCRMLGLEPINSPSEFKDVDSNAWYAGYINAIREAGLIGGYEDGTFKPDKKITREEAFVILYRMAKENLAASGNHPNFADDESIAAWAREAVEALVSAGVVGGYEDGTIKPKNNITRAETVKILAYFLN